MGRRAIRNIEILRDFRELDREYTANTTDSPAVAALNTLPVDERALVILFIACRGNKEATAEYLNTSRKTIGKYLSGIRETLEVKMKAEQRRRDYEDWLSVT